MRILHLDMPRGLSFTLKEWNASCHELLSREDDGAWRQIDLTFDFWRWLLGDRFSEVAGIVHQEVAYSVAALRGAERALIRKVGSLETSIVLAGIAFPERAAKTPSTLLEYVESTPDRAFFDSYFRHLADEHLLLSGCSILSLGVDSLDGLVFAALLADYVRRHDSWIRIVLTRHQYENYSLVHRIDELVADEAFFRLFHAIVPFEEKAGEALLGLRTFFERGDESSLTNVALVTPEGVRAYPPSKTPPGALAAPRIPPSYVQSAGVAPRDLVVFAPLVRNACYYGRCTFCVQNERYLAPQMHKHGPELARAVAMIREYARHGVRSFSFSDQALHPKFLRVFASTIGEQGLDIRWCGRMLFDPVAIDDELCEALVQSGCREILFGLESMNPPTLRAMDKDLGFDVPSAIALLERLERRRIDVVLSLMYGFPTEADDDFERETLSFVRMAAARFSNVSIILNRFGLFRDTPMEKRPQDFGIVDLATAEGPFVAVRQFVDAFGRDSRQPHARDAEYRQAIAPRTSDPLVAYVEYSSMGLAHRWTTGRWFSSAANEATNKPVGRFASQRDTLVLGAGSYVGRNLAAALDAGRLVLSSRGPADEISRSLDAPYLRADLTRGTGQLSTFVPRTAYVVARPTGGFDEQSAFAAHLKTLLHAWSTRGLERVVFLSTQLVYATPDDGEPVPTSAPTDPVQPYEYFKSELETFLRWLARTTKIGVEIVRLPLVFGGDITRRQRDEQLLYVWSDAILAGARFPMGDGDRVWGNSFVYLPDLIGSLLETRGPGVHLRQPVSGDFTYADLQDALLPRAMPASGVELALVRSRFFLRDEEGVPRRDLRDLLGEVVGPRTPRAQRISLPLLGAGEAAGRC